MSLSKEEKLIIQNTCIIIFDTLEKKGPNERCLQIKRCFEQGISHY